MYIRAFAATLAVALYPQLASSQATTAAAPTDTSMHVVANPVATAFRTDAAKMARNLTAAAEDMPENRYGFKPTAAQMSFRDIVNHLSEGNDFLCGKIGGMAAPSRTKLAPKAKKAELVARLKETFAFCDQALANLDDSKLAEQMALFGPTMYTRAATMTITTGDWADHYSQAAIYMRLNGLVPPTAKKKPAA